MTVDSEGGIFSWVTPTILVLVGFLILFDFYATAMKSDTVTFSNPETTSLPVKDVSTDGSEWTVSYLKGGTVETLVLDSDDVAVEDTSGVPVFEYVTFTKTTVEADRTSTLAKILAPFLGHTERHHSKKVVEKGVPDTSRERHVLKVRMETIEERSGDTEKKP